MAHKKENVILQGTHGTFAKQVVFRQRFGQFILCKRPKTIQVTSYSCAAGGEGPIHYCV